MRMRFWVSVTAAVTADAFTPAHAADQAPVSLRCTIAEAIVAPTCIEIERATQRVVGTIPHLAWAPGGHVVIVTIQPFTANAAFGEVTIDGQGVDGAPVSPKRYVYAFRNAEAALRFIEQAIEEQLRAIPNSAPAASETLRVPPAPDPRPIREVARPLPEPSPPTATTAQSVAPSPSFWERPLLVAGVGVVVVGAGLVGVGIQQGVASFDHANDFRTATTQVDRFDAKAQGEQAAQRANVLLGIGTAFAAVGVSLVALDLFGAFASEDTSARSSEASGGPDVRFSPSLRGVDVSLRWSW